MKKIYLFLILLVVTLAVYYQQQVISRNKELDKKFDIQKVVEKYDNCSISFVPDTRQENKKLVWGISFPEAMPERLIRSLVRGVTGIPKGARLFYSYATGHFRHCRGDNIVTALCILNRPGADMNPERYVDAHYFSKNVVMILRNPKTLFAAYANVEHARYDPEHPKGKQMPKEVWQAGLDQNFHDMMETWIKHVRTWKNRAPNMGIALYLPFEYVMDPIQGPILVRRLAKVFDEQGYRTFLSSVAPTEATAASHQSNNYNKDINNGGKDDDTNFNLTCVWYQSVTRAHLERYHNFGGFEHDIDYTHTYTQQQQQFMLSELEQLIEDYQNDTELVDILQFYHADIAQNDTTGLDNSISKNPNDVNNNNNNNRQLWLP